MTSAEYHKCVVCSKNILKDSYIIEKHASTHGISTMTEYRGRLVATRRNERSRVVSAESRKSAQEPVNEMESNTSVINIQPETLHSDRSDSFLSSSKKGEAAGSTSDSGSRSDVVSEDPKNPRCDLSSVVAEDDPDDPNNFPEHNRDESSVKDMELDKTPINEVVKNTSKKPHGNLRSRPTEEEEVVDYDPDDRDPDYVPEGRISNVERDGVAMKLAIDATSNSCKFACKECSLESQSWGDLRTHLSRSHNKKNQKLDCGDYATKTVHHMCAVCGKRLLQDSSVIKTHVKIHDMTLEGYRKHIANDNSHKSPANAHKPEKEVRSSLEESVSEVPGTSYEKQHEGANKAGTISDGSNREVGNSTMSEAQCQTNNEVTGLSQNLPSQSPTSEIASNLTAPTKPQTSGSFAIQEVDISKPPSDASRPFLANECRFQCKMCEETFGSWRELRTHVGKTHKQKYIKCNYEEYVIARCRVYHNCVECGTKVLQDDDIIRLHALTHGIKSLDDYATVYQG